MFLLLKVLPIVWMIQRRSVLHLSGEERAEPVHMIFTLCMSRLGDLLWRAGSSVSRRLQLRTASSIGFWGREPGL